MSAITSSSKSAMPMAHDRNIFNRSTANRSYPVFGMNEWQVEALKRLAGLTNLPANWDTYGSIPISDPVLDAATELVRGASFDAAPIPRVVPVSGGGVQLEWSKGSRELDIQVTPELKFEIVARDGEWIEEGAAPALNAASMSLLLSWLESA